MVKEYGSNFELSDETGDRTEILDTKKVIYLRTAREALFVIGQEIMPKTVLMPALCCTSMVQPFLQLGIKVHYYNILIGFKIDFQDLMEKIESNSLVVIMNYYGFHSYDKKELQNLKSSKENITIVQDCTQHIFDYSLFDDIADYWIGSIRKWFPIVDGAFLASNRNLGSNLYHERYSDDGYVGKYLFAMKLKSKYLRYGDIEDKKLYRQYFAECMLHLKANYIKIHSMSDESRQLFYQSVNCEDVKKRRKENFEVLYTKLNKYTENIKYTTKQNGPLCFNIVVNDRDYIQKKLSENNIYCQVLWPLNVESKKASEFAEWYADHMLAIPCDQRYDTKDMEKIADTIMEILNK